MGFFAREKVSNPAFLAKLGYVLVNEVYQTPKKIEDNLKEKHFEKDVVTIMPETLAKKLVVAQINWIILRNGTRETDARVAIMLKEIIGKGIKSDCFIMIGSKLIKKLNLKENGKNNKELVKYSPVYIRRK